MLSQEEVPAELVIIPGLPEPPGAALFGWSQSRMLSRFFGLALAPAPTPTPTPTPTLNLL